jgi:hypothetical protein
MTKRFENLDFPNSSNGKAICLLFSVDSLQGNNVSSLLVLARKHAPFITTTTTTRQIDSSDTRMK